MIKNNKKGNKALHIFPCPTLKEFPILPDDVSASEVKDCGHCGEKMWFSIKMKGALIFATHMSPPVDIWFGCIPCSAKMVIDDSLKSDDKEIEIGMIRL